MRTKNRKQGKSVIVLGPKKMNFITALPTWGWNYMYISLHKLYLLYVVSPLINVFFLNNLSKRDYVNLEPNN